MLDSHCVKPLQKGGGGTGETTSVLPYQGKTIAIRFFSKFVVPELSVCDQ